MNSEALDHKPRTFSQMLKRGEEVWINNRDFCSEGVNRLDKKVGQGRSEAILDFLKGWNVERMLGEWDCRIRDYRIDPAKLVHRIIIHQHWAGYRSKCIWMSAERRAAVFGGSRHGIYQYVPRKEYRILSDGTKSADITAEGMARAGRSPKRIAATLLAASLFSRVDTRGRNPNSINCWPDPDIGTILLASLCATSGVSWKHIHSAALPGEQFNDRGNIITRMDGMLDYFVAEHARVLHSFAPVLISSRRPNCPNPLIESMRQDW